ncbi:LYR motif-containing protein 2-like [Tubulanus polymorphus]|uniref:LYR motif-containing protein 2-like n=1 Tax=Tubulanus polymorphus TaxID=672921 RepID=UPI003DA5FB78
MSASRLPPAAMNLKQFMLRQEVLKLYREIMRTIRTVQHEEYRVELNTWARSDFKKWKNLTSEEDIKARLLQGRKQLKELTDALNLSR